MTSLDHLLPGPDEAMRCSAHARAIGIRPAGTGIRADRVVLVETSLPWPKPVFDHPTLTEVKVVFDTVARRPTRLWATVPDETRLGSPETEIVVFDRGESGVRRHRYRVDNPNDLFDLATALACEDESALTGVAFDDGPLTEPVMAVCTQGSHDVCCGSEGARFAAAAADRFPHLTVYRVSHTGGHRFAPTAMTFPDGRMWANLTLDLTEKLLGGGFAEEFCRGWWGAEPGYAQTAEAAVRAVRDSGFDAQPRTVTVSAASGDAESGVVECTVSVPDGSWEVVVATSRLVPTIPCRVPGGTPFKTAREFIVESLRPN